MSKNLHIAFFVVCVATTFEGYAQQQSLYSQYIFNLFAVNPAYAGARNALSANASYRAQWVGFEGAPTTQNFNVHGPLKNENMAVGIQFQNDVIGARRAPLLGFTYAYQLKLDEHNDRRISLGLQAGAINYQYDWTVLEYANPGEPIAYGTDGNLWIPNLDFGAMYLAPRGYAGVSATGLQRSRLNAVPISDARLSTFLNFQAGHIFELSQAFSLKAFTMVRHEIAGPVQVDLGLSGLIHNQIWLGTLYRQGFGLVFSAQFVAAKSVVIGYAYDWALNPLRAAQSGTHEVYLGLDFDLFKRPKNSMRYY